MTELPPPAVRYIARLRDELTGIDAAERAAIVAELEDHLADGMAAGRPIDALLSALGPADALARGYAVELALHPRAARAHWIDRALTVIGWLAVASLPSFIIIVVLMATGVAFVAAGVSVFAGGLVGLVRPDLVPDLTVAPWLCLLIGPALLVPGGVALGALYWYVRFLIGVTRRTVARVRSLNAAA